MAGPRLKKPPHPDDRSTEKKSYQIRKQEDREAELARRDFMRHKREEREDERRENREATSRLG